MSIDLLSRIETLEKENERLKSNAEHNEQLIEQYWWENKHYKYIMDELEKWLNDNIGRCYTTIPDYEKYILIQEEETLQRVASKLQELKGE